MAFEDRSLIGDVVRRACGVEPGDPEAKAYMQMMEESLDWMLEEFRRPGPFDFGDPAYFRRGMDWFSSVTRKRLNRAHPMYVYWNRSIFGSKALLLRLRAQVDTHAVLRHERPGFSH